MVSPVSPTRKPPVRAQRRARRENDHAEALDGQEAAIGENTELVRKLIDAYNRRDVPALIAVCDSEVVFTSLMQGLEPRTYRGFGGALRYVETLTDAFEDLQLEPEELREVGDRVVGLGRMRGRGRESGAEVEREWAAVYALRDGKLVWSGVYPTRHEALQAVGLDG
ncbi:MAG: nuclear transport factor 2 family protein [Actinomycetota bacterium]|nr:nuclear transport factor 2 family protein [Actinomycetota bacterium]